MEIKKPYAVVQYSKFIKDIDKADQYLSYCSVMRKVKWSVKGGTVSAKLCCATHCLCTGH